MKWKLIKGIWMSTQPVLPGVWARKDGGHIVRARVIDCTTAKQKEIWKTLPDKDAPAALVWLEEEKARVRAGSVSPKSPSMRFSVFAALELERKLKKGDIKSAMSRNRWKYTMVHLVAAFGDVFVDQLTPDHIESWLVACAEKVREGKWAPTTVNGWLAILKVLTKAAKRQLRLPSDPAAEVEYLDTSEHEVYTDEEPNSLLPEEVAPFVSTFRARHPQHFGMFFVALVTGLRVDAPSASATRRKRGHRLGDRTPSCSSLAHDGRRSHEHDEAKAPLHDRLTDGGRRRPPLARRDPARDAGARGFPSLVSVHHGRLLVMYRTPALPLRVFAAATSRSAEVHSIHTHPPRTLRAHAPRRGRSYATTQSATRLLPGRGLT